MEKLHFRATAANSPGLKSGFLLFNLLASTSQLKEAVSRDFLHIFFHESNPSGSLINCLKWFCKKISFHEYIREKCDSAQCDTAWSRTLHSITLHRVGKFKCQKSKIVSHCTELDSAQCDTARSRTHTARSIDKY